MRKTSGNAPAPHVGMLLSAALLIATAVGLGAPPPATAAAAGAVDASSPSQLVNTAANTLLQALQAHREEYRKDPAKLRELVTRTLLPHFDTQLAARLVLGRYWRSATPDQRSRFIMAFYNSLLNNYGNALLDLTANTMQVLPYRGQPNGQYTTVDTRIRKSDGSTVAVNYQLDKTPEGWKVWDVVVEGISYDKSFQTDFAEQLQREGIEAVISRLQHGETPAAIKHTTGS